MALKNADERLQETIDYISTKVSADGAKLVEMRLDRLPKDKSKPMSEAMSLGKDIKELEKDKGKEKDRRSAIRSAMLLHFLFGEPVTGAKALMDKYGGMTVDKLNPIVLSRLPVTDDSPNRAEWAPAKFTDPKTYDKKKPFKFIVWTLPNAFTGRGISYKKILEDPGALVKTLLLSTTVVDQDHKSMYYPYGVILKVPQENIISTSPTDQSFKNYKAVVEGMTAVVANDMLSEVRRVSAGHHIETPAKILTDTKKKGGQTGYNEIVVMGTSPEGKSVEAAALFLKVADDKDAPYIRNNLGTGKPEAKAYVNDEVTDLLDKLSKAKKLPIVKIVDPIP